MGWKVEDKRVGVDRWRGGSVVGRKDLTVSADVAE